MQRFLDSLKSTTFLLTSASLAGVFLGWGLGHDPHQLEVIVPAILLFYNTARVAKGHLDKKAAMQEQIIQKQQ